MTQTNKTIFFGRWEPCFKFSGIFPFCWALSIKLFVQNTIVCDDLWSNVWKHEKSSQSEHILQSFSLKLNSLKTSLKEIWKTSWLHINVSTNLWRNDHSLLISLIAQSHLLSRYPVIFSLSQCLYFLKENLITQVAGNSWVTSYVFQPMVFLFFI